MKRKPTADTGGPRDQIMRQPEVLHVLSISSSTLWRWIECGQFPRPVRIGGPNSRAVGWLRSTVEDHLSSLQPA